MTNCCGHCLKGNKNMVMFADIYYTRCQLSAECVHRVLYIVHACCFAVK